MSEIEVQYYAGTLFREWYPPLSATAVSTCFSVECAALSAYFEAGVLPHLKEVPDFFTNIRRRT